MSEENLALIDRAFEAFASQDVEAYVRCMDPEVEFEPHIAMAEGGYRGHDGVRRFMADAVEDYGDQAEGLRAAGIAQ